MLQSEAHDCFITSRSSRRGLQSICLEAERTIHNAQSSKVILPMLLSIINKCSVGTGNTGLEDKDLGGYVVSRGEVTRGSVDDDTYLVIHGYLLVIINRGGERVLYHRPRKVSLETRHGTNANRISCSVFSSPIFISILFLNPNLILIIPHKKSHSSYCTSTVMNSR